MVGQGKEKNAFEGMILFLLYICAYDWYNYKYKKKPKAE